MQLVHRNRSKPALEQMPRPAPSGIDEIGVAPMRLSDRQPQTIRSRRSENQVNMIGHETALDYIVMMQSTGKAIPGNPWQVTAKGTEIPLDLWFRQLSIVQI